VTPSLDLVINSKRLLLRLELLLVVDLLLSWARFAKYSCGAFGRRLWQLRDLMGRFATWQKLLFLLLLLLLSCRVVDQDFIVLNLNNLLLLLRDVVAVHNNGTTGPTVVYLGK